MRIIRAGTEQKSKEELAIEGFNHVAEVAIKHAFGEHQLVNFGTRLKGSAMCGFFSADDDGERMYMVMHYLGLGNNLIISRYVPDKSADSSVVVSFAEEDEE